MNNILRQLRGNKTQDEIAKKIGISVQHYNFIENGKRKPSLNVAKKISRLYKTNIEKLFP